MCNILYYTEDKMAKPDRTLTRNSDQDEADSVNELIYAVNVLLSVYFLTWSFFEQQRFILLWV